MIKVGLPSTERRQVSCGAIHHGFVSIQKHRPYKTVGLICLMMASQQNDKQGLTRGRSSC